MFCQGYKNVLSLAQKCSLTRREMFRHLQKNVPSPAGNCSRKGAKMFRHSSASQSLPVENSAYSQAFPQVLHKADSLRPN
jgi:hypothetical protein